MPPIGRSSPYSVSPVCQNEYILELMLHNSRFICHLRQYFLGNDTPFQKGRVPVDGWSVPQAMPPVAANITGLKAAK